MNLNSWTEERKYVDRDENMTLQITKMLDECESKEKLVIWEQFKDYVADLFVIPDYIAEKLINKARERSTYKINRPGPINKSMEQIQQEYRDRKR